MSRGLGSPERGVVGVAALVPAIERGLVPLVERCAGPQALDQVGIGDEGLAEGHRIGPA